MPRLAPDELLVAVDPGRDKCGVVVVDGSGRLLDRLVATTPELADVLAPVLSRHAPSHAIVGGGTAGRFWYDRDGLPLPDALMTLTLLLVLLSRSDRCFSEVLDRETALG